MRNDGEHGSLDAKKQTINQTDTCSQDVEQAEAQHQHGAGHNEQYARNQAAAYAVQIPADVGCKLLRLWPRQQHAQVKGADKTSLINPFALIHRQRVHHGDLGCGTPKREDADVEKCPGELPHGGEQRRNGRRAGHRGHQLAPAGVCGGQLWVSLAARAAQA